MQAISFITRTGLLALVASVPLLPLFARAAEPGDAPTAVVRAAEAAPPPTVSGFGVPLASKQLDDYRGGFTVVKNDMQLSGVVTNNTATDVVTGNNTITNGAFSNASGLPMVIQNSGANVLIQNSTILNVQMN